MKKYLLGILAIVLAISLSASKSYDSYLTVNTSEVTLINVSSGFTYGTNSITCAGSSETPCVLDLSLINPTYWVTDEQSFLYYLATEFPSPATRVSEVNRITIEWKN